MSLLSSLTVRAHISFSVLATGAVVTTLFTLIVYTLLGQ